MSANDEQTAKDEDALSFLQHEYGLKINYLEAHFSRMWTRFNFFVGIETALSVALFALFREKGVFSGEAIPITLVGAVSSVCWYVFGAQDRYLVEVYRRHVKDTGAKMAEKLRLREYLGSDYVHVGDQRTKIEQSVYQWRLEPFSTTKLAAWFPLLVFLYWVIMLVVTWRCRA